MANYTILVHNKSGDNHEYVLFKEEPKPNPTPSTSIFQNAYITGKCVPHETGTCNFQIQLVFNAVTGIETDLAGTTPNDVSSGHNRPQAINTSAKATTTGAENPNSTDSKPSAVITDHIAAQICQSANAERIQGSALHVSTIEGKPKFTTQEPKRTCDVDGSFSISVDGSFDIPVADQIFIGFSAGDPYDNAAVTKISSIPARPNTTNIFTPASKYYVSWGDRIITEAMTYWTMGKPAVVDFSGKRSSIAEVVHNKNGTWTISYV